MTSQRTRFLIAGMQRSGTTVTHLCLHGHPRIHCAGDEVRIDPFFTTGPTTFTFGGESYLERRGAFTALFDALTSVGATEDTAAIGMKVAIGSATDAIDLANCLREYFPDVRVVLVLREDLAAQYASLLRAEDSGRWHAFAGEPERADDSTPLRIDPDSFAAYAADAVRCRAQLESLEQTHAVCRFGYERDIVPMSGFARLFEFLRVPAIPITWLGVRKMSPPTERAIANLAELRARLATLEHPAAHAVEQAARTRAAERDAGERPLFLLDRAAARLRAGRARDAHDGVLGALLRDPPPPLRLLRAGFETLEGAWQQLDDAELARKTLRVLAPRYGDEPAYLRLAAVVAVHTGDRDEGIALLRRAVELRPDDTALRALLADWTA